MMAHIAFQNSVQQYGSKEAVRIGATSASYDDLNKAANKIARHLHEIGTGRGARIGIYLEKSIEAVSSVLGILKAGGVYVPLDCNSPIDRNGYIVSDCGIEVIITAVDQLEKVRELAAKKGLPKTVFLHSQGQLNLTGDLEIIPFDAILKHSDADLPNADIALEDAAAILYTSGTTGLPKGAVITHGNIAAFIEWVADAFEISERDTFVSHAPLHFDLSLLDIHSSLARGHPSCWCPIRNR